VVKDQQDSEWPLIRKDLLAKLDTFIDESRTSQKNHNDALYGFMDDKGQWRKGLVQIVQDSEKRKNTVEKVAGWLLYGVLMAVGIAIVDVLSKFWVFITKH